MPSQLKKRTLQTSPQKMNKDFQIAKGSLSEKYWQKLRILYVWLSAEEIRGIWRDVIFISLYLVTPKMTVIWAFSAEYGPFHSWVQLEFLYAQSSSHLRIFYKVFFIRDSNMNWKLDLSCAPWVHDFDKQALFIWSIYKWYNLSWKLLIG